MTIITKQKDLIEVCSALSQSTAVAVDTEFVRERTYRPILSLVQLANDRDAYIIDFVSGDLDPAPLIEFFLDHTVTKVLHSCRQDFEIFYLQFGVFPNNIFDTQVAYSLLYPGDEVGLGKLLKDMLDLDVSKAQQHTNWLRRPLTDRQVAYALQDVEHLVKVHGILHSQLEEKGRLSWLWEEQAFLSLPETYRVDPEQQWKRFKVRKSLEPKSVLLLQNLCRWREERAQELNVNRARILADHDILKLVERPPISLESFTERFPELTQGQIKEVWSEMEKALRTPRTFWPSSLAREPMTDAQQKKLEELRSQMEMLSQELGISPRLLATQEQLKALCRGEVGLPQQRGWRKEAIGRFEPKEPGAH